jgi:FlaA1/EpsC-like NDP-sugar epimerase
MSWITDALGRSERPEPIGGALDALRARGVVLITGGLGSLGLAVGDALDAAGVEYVATDIDEMDVADPVQVAAVMETFQPATILHLAGAKHAPLGELDPLEPVRVHVDGTANVLRYSPAGCRVVTASTCKACDPETAYGASKLIAERLTLNAGQRVARFHNVVDTAGNVFEIWREQADDEPIMYADCWRYFISSREAVSLLLYAAASGTGGRYSFDAGMRHTVHDVARRLHPGRVLTRGNPRRGDRIAEPFMAHNEHRTWVTDSIVRVQSPHDPEAA